MPQLRKQKNLPTEQLPGRLVDSMSNPSIIGRIARPVGIRGDLKIYPETDLPDRLESLDKIHVLVGTQVREFTVSSVVKSGPWFRFKLNEIDNADVAGLLAGCEIIATTADRAKLKKDEFFIDDLIGCEVAASSGEQLGILSEIVLQDHHDLWVVDGDYGEILIPAVSAFIKDVDIANHRIVINKIDGLWDNP